MGRPLPEELRDLYLCARPRTVGEEHWPSVAICTLDDPGLRWSRIVADAPAPVNLIIWEDPDPIDDWMDAEGVLFGANPFFDRLFWIKDHRRHPDGCILFTSHECDDLFMPMVARSLAEYISRLCFFKGEDLISSAGERATFPAEHFRLLAREFVELNPLSEAWREIAEES
jgi:hypothetical protein